MPCHPTTTYYSYVPLTLSILTFEIRTQNFPFWEKVQISDVNGQELKFSHLKPFQTLFYEVITIDNIKDSKCLPWVMGHFPPCQRNCFLAEFGSSFPFFTFPLGSDGDFSIALLIAASILHISSPAIPRLCIVDRQMLWWEIQLSKHFRSERYVVPPTRMIYLAPRFKQWMGERTFSFYWSDEIPRFSSPIKFSAIGVLDFFF